VYPVVGSPAAGGLASLDRPVTVLADPSRSVAEGIWQSVVAAIGEICALNTRSEMRVLWMRHQFPQFSRFCVAPSVWHRAGCAPSRRARCCQVPLDVHRCGAPRFAPFFRVRPRLQATALTRRLGLRKKRLVVTMGEQQGDTGQYGRNR